MSYTIYLKDPVTEETLELLPHDMQGCNILIDEGYNRIPTTKAGLGITYNYSKYYYEAAEDGLGIRTIYGKSGAESLPLLRIMIDYLKSTYCKDGIWVEGEEPTNDYWEATAANALKPLYQLKAMAQLRPDGIWEGD